jgi:signal peptidase I
MEPTYLVGDTIDVDLDAYKSSDPKSGDVVILNPPAGAVAVTECGVSRPPDEPCPKPTPDRSSAKFIKRIVGTPGERLTIIGGRTYVNGKRVS